jgi:hypothetical protein
VQNQAALLADIDVFWMFMIFAALLVPVALIPPRVERGAASAAMWGPAGRIHSPARSRRRLPCRAGWPRVHPARAEPGPPKLCGFRSGDFFT